MLVCYYTLLTPHSSSLRNPLRWYSDRAEVRRWQADTKSNAVKDARAYRVPFVTTLLGRNRPLPDLMSADRSRWVQGAGDTKAYRVPFVTTQPPAA